MIICITGEFDIVRNGYPTGKKEFYVSHGINAETGEKVILPNEHPRSIGAIFDVEMEEWILER